MRLPQSLKDPLRNEPGLQLSVTTNSFARSTSFEELEACLEKKPTASYSRDIAYERNPRQAS